MEQGYGTIDKCRVLDIQPVRTLVPIFPSKSGAINPTQSPPFISVGPNGPFPPAFTPFYPFSIPQESQNPPEQRPQTPIAVPNKSPHFGLNNNPISTAVPLNSFRTPQTKTNENTHESEEEEDVYSENAQYYVNMTINDEENIGASLSANKNKSQKRIRKPTSRFLNMSPDVEIEAEVNRLLSTYYFDGIHKRKEDGDKESVEFCLRLYNMLRKRLTQTEELKDAHVALRRPDLKSGTLLMTKGIRTNIKKRIGAVPGVEVGDIFFFRMELCLVGLHAPSMAGIDYMGVKVSLEEEPLAVSIVSSGGYEDDTEDGNVLVYSGQGGNANIKGKESADQKLERGNLALEKSLHRGNEVRVIRGMKDGATVGSKVYVYDGLYKINSSWIEKAKSGCNVFKYKLVRLPGQPDSFLLWKLIQQWKVGLTSRVGVILPDLTSGAENLPVSLVNDVDDEKGPACFTYFPSLKYVDPINSVRSISGCSCKGGCQSSKGNTIECSCISINGGYLHYTANGVLVDSKSIIYECGDSCLCPPNCRNRVSQTGLKVKLEVFKTKNRGWGLRSWDPIRAGAFICEYAGEVFHKSKMEEIRDEIDDEYIFDVTRVYQPTEFIVQNSYESREIPFPLIISSKNVGNVGRFMNHSCSPNVVWQQMFYGYKSESNFHVAFFAIKHIPPMTELTFDYGMIESNNAEQRKKKCLCGYLKCRNYFY